MLLLCYINVLFEVWNLKFEVVEREPAEKKCVKQKMINVKDDVSVAIYEQYLSTFHEAKEIETEEATW